jgi:small subunit ribosomal protein S6
MRRYESIIIFDPDLSEEQRSPVLERAKELIPQQGGFLAFIDDWGAKKLAYEIKKKERGYYVRFDYCGTAALVDEMERFFRIDDRVLKYMTVLIDQQPNLENIKEEMAKAEIQKNIPAEIKEPEDVQAPEVEAAEVETIPEESDKEEKE